MRFEIEINLHNWCVEKRVVDYKKVDERRLVVKDRNGNMVMYSAQTGIG